ncbi:MAG: hypothetical protein ABIS29_10895 [Vicinamibacterales bacterium]
MRLRDCQCDKHECPECGPLVALAQQIRQEFENTTRVARVPTPEIVWWRAQMRARDEAARKAARPILFTQALAIAALIGLLVSVAGRLTLPALSFVDMSPLSVGAPVLYIVIAAASCLLIAPLAVYLALARD